MEALFGAGALVVILGIVLFAIILLYFVPMGLWISAITAGVKVQISELIGMRLRKVPPGPIVQALIVADKAGIDVTLRQLETHHLAGGHVQRVMEALVLAKKANTELTFMDAAILDLARGEGDKTVQAAQAALDAKRPSSQGKD